MKKSELPAPITIDQPTIKSIEMVAKSVDLTKLETMDRIQAMKEMANGVAALRSLLTDELVRSVKENLEGHTLGFRTDRDDFHPNHRDEKRRGPKGYPVPVIRDFMIHALIFGARLTMDDCNIIGGNFYARKPCLIRKCKTFPGVTDFDIEPGIPKIMVEGEAGYRDKGANTRIRRGQTGAIVPMKAKWTMEGKVHELTRNIPVKLNAYMGTDAAIGKATRKMAAQTLEYLTGRPVPDGDVDDIHDIEATVVDTKPGQGSRARSSDTTNRVPPETNGSGAPIEPDMDSVEEPAPDPPSERNKPSAVPVDSRPVTERSGPARPSGQRTGEPRRTPPPLTGGKGGDWVQKYRDKWEGKRSDQDSEGFEEQTF